MSEKDELIQSFLKIRGNFQTNRLNHFKKEFERYLIKEDDEDIKDLYNITNALMISFETNNKVEPRKWVSDLSHRLNSKSDLSLFEIRLLNYILFTENNLQNLINHVNKGLEQLKNYKLHEDYYRVKMTLKLNLVNLLLESKFFDPQFKDEFNELIIQNIHDIIEINLNHHLNNKYYVGTASIYKGILLKDKQMVYMGFLLVELSEEWEKIEHQSIKDLIDIYRQRYNIQI